MWDTILLAIVQGVAEFLPISSSGHLVLGKHFLGMSDAGMRLDIFLHVGTLAAVFWYYRRVVAKIAVKAFVFRDWSYVWKILVSAVPAGVVGVLFKDRIESAFANPHLVGAALMFTGVVLLALKFVPKGSKDVSYGHALLMGVAQAVAILPGVSRSGMTIAAGRAAGVKAERCAEFSFLMSAPPIAGAALLDVLKLAKDAPVGAQTPWLQVAVGSVLAAAVGYFALMALERTLRGRWFWLFGPYCLAAGLLAFLLI